LVTIELMVIALVIALEPLPVTGFMVVLASENGIRKGAAFVAGWLGTLVAIVAITAAAIGDSPPATTSVTSQAASAVRLLVGVGLVIVGMWRWTHIGRLRAPRKVPAWQAGVDGMSMWWAALVGCLIQPWPLVAVGIATIIRSASSSWRTGVTLIGFCLVATSSLLTMELYAAFRPRRTQVALAQIRHWIVEHTDQAIIILSLTTGLWLIGDSLYILTS